jgi:hypothetical protein
MCLLISEPITNMIIMIEDTLTRVTTSMFMTFSPLFLDSIERLNLSKKIIPLLEFRHLS